MSSKSLKSWRSIINGVPSDVLRKPFIPERTSISAPSVSIFNSDIFLVSSSEFSQNSSKVIEFTIVSPLHLPFPNRFFSYLKGYFP